MTNTKKSNKKKISALISMVLWAAAFLLLFVTPSGSKYIWTSDFLLLAGFFPLLWVYPAGWTWLIFGTLNAGIGFILEIGYHIPNEYFTPEVSRLKNMLQNSHPTLVWILLGTLCIIFGAFRMIKNGILLFRRLRMKKVKPRHGP